MHLRIVLDSANRVVERVQELRVLGVPHLRPVEHDADDRAEPFVTHRLVCHQPNLDRGAEGDPARRRMSIYRNERIVRASSCFPIVELVPSWRPPSSDEGGLALRASPSKSATARSRRRSWGHLRAGLPQCDDPRYHRRTSGDSDRALPLCRQLGRAPPGDLRACPKPPSRECKGGDPQRPSPVRRRRRLRSRRDGRAVLHRPLSRPARVERRTVSL